MKMKFSFKYVNVPFIMSLFLLSSCQVFVVGYLFMPKTSEEEKIYEEFHALGYPYIESPMRPAWVHQSDSQNFRSSDTFVISLATLNKDGTPISSGILKYHLLLTIANACPYGYEEIYHILNEQKIKCHSKVFTKEIHVNLDSYCLTPTQEIKIQCVPKSALL